MFRSYDHLQVEIYILEINMTGPSLALIILILGVCILLRALDQAQGSPSNTTMFQYLFTVLFKISAKCFGRTTIFRWKYVNWKLT
jgi:hypothetical protein